MLKESISGVRGIVGESFTPEVIAKYCGAFASMLPPGPIVIARDSRPSGRSIERFVSSTLRLAGRDIIYIGIQATPTAEIITDKTKASGGIIITASHNPIEWNALKFLREDGLFLGADDFKKLRAATKREIAWASHSEIGSEKVIANAENYHIDAIIWLPWLEAGIIRDAKLKVVLDANSGTGAIVLLPLLEKLGCEIVQLECEPDGIFTHDPEPRPENLTGLEKAVIEHGADIGLATDPDADRLALVDEKGVAIGEEYTLAIGAAEVIHFNPGPIVVNLSTSAMVESLGQPVFRTKVGEINVAEKMLEIGSPVGGEGNGGLIVPACHPGRDGALAAATILHRLARTGETLSRLAGEFPKLYMIKEKINVRIEEDALAKILAGEFDTGKIDMTDGVRIALDDAWLHVRASNTEDILRIIAEAKSEDRVKSLVERARKLLE